MALDAILKYVVQNIAKERCLRGLGTLPVHLLFVIYISFKPLGITSLSSILLWKKKMEKWRLYLGII